MRNKDVRDVLQIFQMELNEIKQNVDEISFWNATAKKQKILNIIDSIKVSMTLFEEKIEAKKKSKEATGNTPNNIGTENKKVTVK